MRPSVMFSVISQSPPGMDNNFFNLHKTSAFPGWESACSLPDLSLHGGQFRPFPGRFWPLAPRYAMMFRGVPFRYSRTFSNTISARSTMLSSVAKATWGVSRVLGTLHSG